MIYILDFIRKNLAYLIPTILVAGLINGYFNPIPYSRIICASALLLMIFPVFINLDIVTGIKDLKYFKGILAFASLLNFIIYPLVAFGLGWLFLKDYPAMWLGLTLLALVPTSGMTINWTYFTKGNMSVAMGVVSLSIIGSVIILPFAIPYLSEILLETGSLHVSKISILEKLFFIIVFPAIFGYIIRTLIIKLKGKEIFNKIKPINTGISAIGVLLVSFMIMSLETTQTMITSNFNIIWTALIPLFLFYIVMFIVSHYSSKKLNDEKNSKALFFATVPRYHVISLGIILSTFEGQPFLGGIALTIALGLTIQIPSLAFYAKWIHKEN